MSETKNIYQRINAVMRDCEYIQKEKAQQGKGIKYDQVVSMIRQLIIKNGIVVVMRQKSFELSSGVDETKQKIYNGCYEMDFINMDAPTEIVTHSCFGQGMDGGDKAAGKAHTYAAKLMLTKGFLLESGEDEESRSEKAKRLTAERIAKNSGKRSVLNDRLKVAIDNIKAGTYDLNRLKSQYFLTDEQNDMLNKELGLEDAD